MIQYIRERFPIPAVLLFSLGFSLYATGLSFTENIWISNFTSTLFSTLLLISIFFFFLLRQRVVDEFRDAGHDSKNYPNRPLQRGLVTKNHLIAIGIFAFVIEVVSAMIVGLNVFILYLLFLGYSLLMAKELFLKEFLDKHFTLYFIIHEFIFLLLGLFFISSFKNQFLEFNFQNLITLLVITIAPIGVELIRKFKPRYNKSKLEVMDTYTAVWGRKDTVYLLGFINLIVGFSLFMLKEHYIFMLLSILLFSLFVIATNSSRKSDNKIIIIEIIGFLGFALLSNIIW